MRASFGGSDGTGIMEKTITDNADKTHSPVKSRGTGLYRYESFILYYFFAMI